jgi:hypothetical protein
MARCLGALVLALVLLPAGVAQGARGGDSQPMLGILVQFGDQPARTSPADWRRRLFGETDSVRATLQGAVTIVPAAERHGADGDGIVGWLTVHRHHPDFGDAVDVDGPQLAQNALAAAARHVRLADFDTDGDGVVSPHELLVVIVVAGNEAAVGDACRPSVWAHHGETPLVAVDGVAVAAYAMLGEMHCADGSAPGAQATADVVAEQAAGLLGLPEGAPIAEPAAGEYTVVVPNGGEAWVIGSIRRIEWQSTLAGDVSAQLSRDDGTTWTTIFAGLVNDGAHKWTVTGPVTNRARLRVCSVTAPSVCDRSDAAFVINFGTVTVTSPNGGQTWPVESIRRIEWTSTVAGNVAIELSRDGGTSWTTLFASLENDGAQNWTVTGPTTSRARIRVCSVATPRSCAKTALFAIGGVVPGGANLVAPLVIVPSLTVMGGQPWVAGVITANTGTATAGPSRTDIYLSSDSTLTTGDLRMVSFWVPALRPGEVDEQAKRITFPSISPGLYRVAARVDALGAVAETDENNWFALPTGFRVFVFGSPAQGDTLAAP